MALNGKIEIDISAITADISAITSNTLNKNLVIGNFLVIVQPPGTYNADPIKKPGEVKRFAYGFTRPVYAVQYYRFRSITPGARAGAILQLLELLKLEISGNNYTVNDYCSLLGEGTLLTDPNGREYKQRTGLLSWTFPQNTMRYSAGDILYGEGLEITFQEY